MTSFARSVQYYRSSSKRWAGPPPHTQCRQNAGAVCDPWYAVALHRGAGTQRREPYVSLRVPFIVVYYIRLTDTLVV